MAVPPVRRVSYRLAAARDMRLDFVTRYCVGPDIGSGTSESRDERNNSRRGSRAIFDVADPSDRQNSVAVEPRKILVFSKLTLTLNWYPGVTNDSPAYVILIFLQDQHY